MTPQEDINEESSGNEEETSRDESDLAPARRFDAIYVIDQFGGIRPMAAKIGVAVTTVQGWKSRAAIPPDRWEAISAAAAKHGIDLKSAVEAQGEVVGEAPEDAQGEARGDAAEMAVAETLAPPNSLSQIKKQSSSGLAWIALVASLVAVVVATSPYWGPLAGVQSPALMSGRGAAQDLAVAARIDKLATRLTALETEMAGLPARLAALTTASDLKISHQLAALESDVAARLDALATRIAALGPKFIQRLEASETTTAARMDKLAAQLAVTSAKPDPELSQRLEDLEADAVERRALQASLTAAQDRLQAVEQSLESAVAALNSRAAVLSTDLAAIRKAQHVDTDDRVNNRSAALTLALSGLEAVLTTDRPFQLALTALRDVAGDQARWATLVALIEPFAATGAPTLAQLTRQYGDLAPVLARRESVGSRKDWVGQTLDRFYDVVSWRQIGGPIDQAADALAARDLTGAVEILRALPDLEPVARDWLSGARNRITATATLDGLRARITASQAKGMQIQPGQNQETSK